MKIMFATPSYWPSKDGVTQITKYLAEGLAARGHQILVFTSAGNGGLQELPTREIHDGVMIERIRVYVRWPMKLQGRDKESTAGKYYERIKSFAPDVFIVVCSQTWTLDWISPLLDQIDCKKVFYSHGYSGLRAHNQFWEKIRNRNIIGAYEELCIGRYYRNLYKVIVKFDLAIYLSELNNSYLYAQKYGLTNGKVLENAIEDIFLDSKMIHSKEKLSQQEIQYLYVANYNDNKNQDMLLKAFCEADIKNATLQFSGFEENDYLEMLRDHLDKWMPDHSDKRVIFNVHLTREEVYDLYRNSDVFVSTSRSENCPIVHCEAAATGMAVVSTDVGDVRLKDGIWLIENEEQLREALEELYNNRQELYERGQKLRNYMCGRGCRVQDKVDWLEKELERL